MRILIADDSIVSRHLLDATLRKWGYEVVVACDGVEAWNVPARPCGAGLPDRSVTGDPPSSTVYVPGGAAYQLPPGGASSYVMTIVEASPCESVLPRTCVWTS